MLTALLLLTGGVASVMPAAAAVRTGSEVPAAAFTVSGSLSAVAATSPDNAWAVGSSGSGALIVRWNGAAWRRVPSPAPAGSRLSGVAASSARNAWAVGCSGCSGTGVERPVILRWNGTAWKQVPSPSPYLNQGLADFLGGVAVTSADSAWTVGDANCGCGPGINVTERWNGTAWKQVASPSPGGGASLSGVAAVSARTVWAVGVTGSGDGPEKTLTLWWNGSGWKRVSSPSPGATASLSAVAATSAKNAWAVGYTSAVNHGNPETLILRWNGKAWS
jgi:hypothetical protein